MVMATMMNDEPAEPGIAMPAAVPAVPPAVPAVPPAAPAVLPRCAGPAIYPRQLWPPVTASVSEFKIV